MGADVPLYEYECGACGGFAATRPMSASAHPAPCPGCGGAAPRILSATAVTHGRGRRRRGAPEPRLVSHQREPTKPKPIAAQGDRPWMLGH